MILYISFKKIIEGVADSFFYNIFYLYILYKSKIRQELVQLNSKRGFTNFQEYQYRKSVLLPSKRVPVYKRMMKQFAILSFVAKDTNNRYVESRINFPKGCKKSKDIRKDCEKFNKALRSNQFFSSANAIEPAIIYNFIKLKDAESKDGDFQYRNFDLRITAKQQIMALGDFKNETNLNDRCYVIGIDAASSELYCRPEVFAQAYRYAKYVINSGSKDELGFTYHVGEDFFSIVDGLRAIDEAIRFLNLTSGDRLGHCLALGTDVKQYYENRNNTVVMCNQYILDNIVWLLFNGVKSPHYISARGHLVSLYEEYLKKVYTTINNVPSVDEYYKSWLLRGDNPEDYIDPEEVPHIQSRDLWCLTDFVHGIEYDTARQNSTSKNLYISYHYNEDVRKNGRLTSEIKLNEDILSLIQDVQHDMLDKFEKLNISIECNPTSNLRIGDFNRFIDHPIMKFYNYGLEVDYDPHEIPVSINTDDKGVFSTSLEREYSLLAAALKKDYDKGLHHNSPVRIINWLNQIREMGLASRFGK